MGKVENSSLRSREACDVAGCVGTGSIVGFFALAGIASGLGAAHLARLSGLGSRMVGVIGGATAVASPILMGSATLGDVAKGRSLISPKTHERVRLVCMAGLLVQFVAGSSILSGLGMAQLARLNGFGSRMVRVMGVSAAVGSTLLWGGMMVSAGLSGQPPAHPIKPGADE